MELGCHVNRDWVPARAANPRPSIAEHIEAAASAARDAGGIRFGVAQIFIGGPHNQTINLGAEEAEALRALIGRTGIRVVAHSSYACNPWKGNPHAAAYIREELRSCQAAGISGLVVHLPKQPIAQVMAYLPRLVEPGAPDVRVFLETPANTPAETYYERPSKLAALFREIRQNLDPYLSFFGLCVDTAHLWVAGVDLRGREPADRWLEDLARQIPELVEPSPVPRLIFHLNDSLRERGKGPDAHAPLAKGRIWAELAETPEESGLGSVADFARRHRLWAILERKPNSALTGDYHLMRRLRPELAEVA